MSSTLCTMTSRAESLWIGGTLNAYAVSGHQEAPINHIGGSEACITSFMKEQPPEYLPTFNASQITIDSACRILACPYDKELTGRIHWPMRDYSTDDTQSSQLY